MLFNSYAFIFAFLPIAWIGYHLLRLWKFNRVAVGWLALASIAFYGIGNLVFLPILLGSILFNYAVGRSLARLDGVPRWRSAVLVGGVAANLLLLGYFKYANFFVDNATALTGIDWTIAHIALPIGISFFTFQKIAFVVDSYRRRVVPYDFWQFCLFASFFPQLIAGPIVHHREMMPQFDPRRRRRVIVDVAAGLTAFAIGLFKKVIVADTVAGVSTPVFDAAAGGAAPGLVAAWSAALCYTMQIYYDFSAYSDMAIGLGLMFGIRLPINFLSPYKSTSIIEFWRRWHITLSRFLRDYLYIPLGGNRRGRVRRYVNVFLTMLLGGIWHGANWTFVLWGAMHGIFIVVNQLWRAAVPSRLTVPAPIAWAMTFLCVVAAWVPFRAADLSTTAVIYRGMLGLNGLGTLPEPLAGAAEAGAAASGLPALDPWAQLVMLPLALAATLILPATATWMRRWRPALVTSGYPSPGSGVELLTATWRPTLLASAFIAILLALSLTKLNDVSEFIYFKF